MVITLNIMNRKKNANVMNIMNTVYIQGFNVSK